MSQSKQQWQTPDITFKEGDYTPHEGPRFFPLFSREDPDIPFAFLTVSKGRCGILEPLEKDYKFPGYG